MRLLGDTLMVITLDTADSRTVKAIELAATAGGWARCHTADGRKMYGIPASGDPLHLYLTTLTSCSCPAARHHGERECKHRMALRLHVALAQACKNA